ncbi:MAG: hypothetical protein ACMUIU_00070 [bacterium]
MKVLNTFNSLNHILLKGGQKMVIMILKKTGIFLILFSILGFLVFAAIAYCAAWNYPISTTYPLTLTSQFNIPSQAMNSLFTSSLFSTSFDYYRGANSPERTAMPNNSFQDMYFLNPFTNYFSNPFSYVPLGFSQGIGIYPYGSIGAFQDYPFSLASQWTGNMPVSYPTTYSPFILDRMNSIIGYNTTPYQGLTPNTYVQYTVMLTEYNEDNEKIYYLMPKDADCPCIEYAEDYGIPCSLVEGTKYIFKGKTYAKFSVLANPLIYLIAEMPTEATE